MKTALVLLLLFQADDFRSRAGKIDRNAAAKHYAVGESMTTAQMHLWAREQYLLAVELDPDHEGARRRLGYNKGPDGWAADPAAKLETLNRKTGPDADRLRKSRDEKLEQAGKDLARQWAELAAWCRKSKLDAEAEQAWRRCLEHDAGHPGARKELGYEKNPQGGWMSRAERAFRAEMRDGVEATDGGKAVEGESPFEKAVGPTRKREGQTVVVESTFLKDEGLAAVLRRADHAAAMFRKLFGPVGLKDAKLRLLVLKDTAQHERFVRAFGQKPVPDAVLKARASGGGGTAEIWQGDAPDALVWDWAIHITVQALLQTWTKPEHVWLYEGLGLHFTRLMQDTALIHCVDLGGTRPENQGKRYNRPDEWPSVCKVWVRDGGDPDIAAVLKCRNFAELDGAEAVKGWSLVDFLLAEHREAFGRYIAALPGQEVEAALQEVFGWTLADLDRRWKAYVKTNY